MHDALNILKIRNDIECKDYIYYYFSKLNLDCIVGLCNTNSSIFLKFIIS